jgi:hypothetical protein
MTTSEEVLEPELDFGFDYSDGMLVATSEMRGD